MPAGEAPHLARKVVSILDYVHILLKVHGTIRRFQEPRTRRICTRILLGQIRIRRTEMGAASAELGELHGNPFRIRHRK